MKKINLILVSIMLLCMACSSDDNGNSQSPNQPPSAIVLTSPINNALGTDKNISFTYNVPEGDPEGDPITYDIYLDNGIEELKIAENLNEESFTYNEPLGLNRNYTWRVVAKDNNGGQRESETFSFKTRKAIYESGTANYLPRSFHNTVLYDDNFVIIAGADPDLNLLTDSRKSLNGFFWETAPSNLPVRVFGASVVLNSNIYTVGGWDATLGVNTYLNDVYQLSGLSGASTWGLVNESASFSPRRGHSLIVLNDKIYLMGGADGTDYFEDVYMSGNGNTWNVRTVQAQFGPRAFHTSVAFKNRIWLIAGSNGTGYKSDVWYSEDGINWVLATENAGFTERAFHASVVFDNKIWVYGGFSQDDNTLGDLWYSEDGINWYEAGFEDGVDTLPEGLRDSSLVVKNDAMYLIGGTDDTGTYINYTIRVQ